MYKTTVYTLVNGGITHQKPQISERVDIKCQCTWNDLLEFLDRVKILIRQKCS